MFARDDWFSIDNWDGPFEPKNAKSKKDTNFFIDDPSSAIKSDHVRDKSDVSPRRIPITPIEADPVEPKFTTNF